MNNDFHSALLLQVHFSNSQTLQKLQGFPTFSNLFQPKNQLNVSSPKAPQLLLRVHSAVGLLHPGRTFRPGDQIQYKLWVQHEHESRRLRLMCIFETLRYYIFYWSNWEKAWRYDAYDFWIVLMRQSCYRNWWGLWMISSPNLWPVSPVSTGTPRRHDQWSSGSLRPLKIPVIFFVVVHWLFGNSLWLGKPLIIINYIRPVWFVSGYYGCCPSSSKLLNRPREVWSNV